MPLEPLSARMAVPAKTMRSALTAAGVAAVTGGFLLLCGVQREISGGVAGIAGIAAGVSKRRKSKIVREVSENNAEANASHILLPKTTSQQGEQNLAEEDWIAEIKGCDILLKTEPNNVDLLFRRGVAKSNLGDYSGSIEDYNKALESEPNDANLYFNRAVAKAEAGDRDGAIRDYSEAIEKNPDHYLAFYNRGIEKSEAGDHEGCILDLSRSIDIYPEYIDALYRRAITLRDQGAFDGAVDDLTKALSIDPSCTEVYRERAFANSRAGRLNEAIDDYSILITHDPGNYLLYLLRGLCKRRNGDASGALTDFDQIVRIAPDNPTGYIEKAEILIAEQKREEVEHCLESAKELIEMSQQKAVDIFRIGYMSVWIGCYEEGIELLTTAIELGLEDEFLKKAYANRAVAFHETAQYEKCLGDAELSLSMPDYDISNRLLAQLHSRKGYCNRALGKLENALDDAREAALLDKNDMYLNDLGNIEQELGLYREAVGSFTEAFSLAPENAFILTNRANAKSLSGDLVGALNDYTKAIERGDHTAYYNRANLQLNQLKDYDAAIEDFTSAINCDTCSDKHHYYYNRAYTKSLTGDLEGALRDCDLALGIDSEYFRPIRLKAKTCYRLGDLYHARESYLRLVHLGAADLIDYQELGSIENKLESFDSAARYLQHSNEMNIYQSEDSLDLETFSKSSYYLAHSLYRMGDYEEALTVTTECEKHVDADAEFLRLTACILDEMGNSEKAIETINRALSLDDNIPEIWYDRGVIRRDSDDFEGAIADFKQAFALDSSFTSACHNIGSIYMHTGNMTQACHYWRMASDLGDQDAKRLVDEYCGEE